MSTFKELQDDTIQDSFDESDRVLVKKWINSRLGYLWGLNEWTFTKGHALVAVTAGSSNVTNLPADFKIAVSLQRGDGCPLREYEEYLDFADNYLGTLNTAWAGLPQGFTVQGGVMTVGPTSTETNSSYLLVYEKGPTPLVADSDVPNIPWEFHDCLIDGAKATGFGRKSVLLADPFEAKFKDAIQAMTRSYLTEVRGSNEQMPAYRPGGYGRFW